LVPLFKKFKKENSSVNVYLMMGNDDFKIICSSWKKGNKKDILNYWT
jgi:hypothetical protein